MVSRKKEEEQFSEYDIAALNGDVCDERDIYNTKKKLSRPLVRGKNKKEREDDWQHCVDLQRSDDFEPERNPYRSFCVDKNGATK